MQDAKCAVYREKTMLNPYAPPSDPTPILRNEEVVDHRSIWFPVSISVAGSALAAVALVAIHYFSLNMANPIAAFAMTGFVIAIQVFASAQISRRLQTKSVLASQCVNGMSWMAVVGVLAAAHYILPSVPELRWPDMVVFGGLALVSALLSVLACYVVKLRS